MGDSHKNTPNNQLTEKLELQILRKWGNMRVNEMPPSKHKCRFYKEKPWEINWLQKNKISGKATCSM